MADITRYKYEHRQAGGWCKHFMVLSVLFVVLVFWYALKHVSPPDKTDSINLIILAVAAVLTVVPSIWAVLALWSMTVRIDDEFVRVIFGPGVFFKKFPLKNIIDSNPVKNSWRHGWGIRKYQEGWLYNIAGFDAVEITMVSGKKNRIGTDEPEKLASVINFATEREK